MDLRVCAQALSAALLTIGLAATCGTVRLTSQSPALQKPADSRPGSHLYRAACASCHGPDGRGVSAELSGLELPLPDFTDCRFAVREADADWFAVVHDGGPVRGFDRRMPAFGDALSDEDILRVLHYVRRFCASTAWPRGELNLPRALVTGKAYPEDEAVLTFGATDGAVTTTLIYERRVGAVSQLEIAVPIVVRSHEASRHGGVGDIVLAAKHTLAHSVSRGHLLSAGAEVILPTGDRESGLGTGTMVFEPFVAYGQVLPRDGFIQLHAGLELPADRDRAAREAYWRVAVGKSMSSGGLGRVWSPILELAAGRELERGSRVTWDVVPQVQVSLSARQHVLLNVGVRLPVGARAGRDPQVLAYLLWDWFDGGLLDGW